MTPAEFHPTFQEGVPSPQGTPVNPKFCLTDASALDLQALLAKDRVCSIVLLHPLTGLNVNPKVPWLAFPAEPGPVNINAGVLADGFTKGKNPDVAYTEMLAHIDQTISDQTS
jgi:hypothetical protein